VIGVERHRFFCERHHGEIVHATVIRLTLLPFLYYALLPGALGYAIVWWAQKGPVNAGTVLATAIALAAIVWVSRGVRSGRE